MSGTANRTERGRAVSHNIPEPDPHSEFEDEGIPDLQDGTPQQQRAVDPQQAPLPADQPTAVDDFGATVEEQIEGEPLDLRVDREVPEEQAMFGEGEPVVRPAREGRPDRTDAPEAVTEDSGLGVGADLDTEFEPDTGTGPDWEAQPEEPSGQVWEAPRRAGRLVAPDEGAHPDEEADAVAGEAGPDRGGYTAEEAAMRVEPG
jgi:hypothetical protein